MDENEEFEFRLRAEQEARTQAPPAPVAPVKPADPMDYTDRYNTQLKPDQERAFGTWSQSLGERGGSRDYDMRGAWLAGAGQAANGHFPDTFKKPNHPTFSAESQYNGQDGHTGGAWAKQPDGTWSFTPTADMLKMRTPDQMYDYFDSTEKGNKLVLPEQKGQYLVTGDNGRQSYRQNVGAGDILQSVYDMPLIGTAANAAVGAVNTGVKAVSGLLGLGGADPKAVQNTFHVDPVQTKDPVSQALGAVQGGIEKAVAPIDKAVENLPDGPRTIIQGAEEAIPEIAGVLGAKVPLEGVANAAKAARAPVAGAATASGEDVLGTLRGAGYKFRPSDVKAMKPGEKVPGLKREGLQDAAGLKKDFILDNQPTTTKLAAEDLGAPGKTALMEKDYEKLRAPHFKVYEDVEKAANLAPSLEYANALKDAQERAGLKGGASATESISALRRNARKRARSDDVKVNKEGDTDMEVADALENQLGDQLKAQGDEKLMNDYRTSRQALAKIHDYESATRGGQVDAHVMRRIDDKNPGRMTGNAKIISDAADYAKNVTRHSQSATGVKSSVKADTVAGMVKNVAGKAISKLPGMDVTRTGFQNKFGREATPAERASFKDYGKRAPRAEPVPPREPQLGSGNVDFTPTPGVQPAASLADELELAPEPVQNPVRLPEKPDMLSADVPPVQSGVPFRGSPDVSLAGELGLMPERPAGGIDYTPEPMGDTGGLQLALADLAEQLGLNVGTTQPSLMTPETAPGYRRAALERPPGRVGKPRK